MPRVVLDSIAVEWIDGLESEARHAARHDAVFDVNRRDATRLERAKERGREVAHVLPEVRVRVGVPEVSIAVRILVLSRERDARDDQPDAVLRLRAPLVDRVVVDQRPTVTRTLATLAGQLVLQHRHGTRAGESVLAHDRRHLRDERAVHAPLLFEHAADLALRLGVDDVDDDRAGLEEAVDAVHRLDEVVELVTHTEKHHPAAVALEVAAAPEHHGLGREEPNATIGEAHDDVLARVDVLRAIDALHLGKRALDRLALRLEVVPQHEVLFGLRGDDLSHLRDAIREAHAGLARGVRDARGGVGEHLHLRALRACERLLSASACEMIGRQLVPADFERREHVARVVVLREDVRRLRHEHGPRADPEPELSLLVGMDRERVGVLGVALEEPGLRGRDVHHIEEGAVGEKLDELVRRGRGRRDEAIAHRLALDPLTHVAAVVTGEERHELAEGLRPAEAAQTRGLVERGAVERARVELSVAHGLVVRQVDAGLVGLFDASDEAHRDAHRLAVSDELLPHAEGRHDEESSAGVRTDLTREFDLHTRLAESEGRKDRSAALAKRPRDDGALKREERFRERKRRLESRVGRFGFLGVNEGLVVHDLSRVLSRVPCDPGAGESPRTIARGDSRGPEPSRMSERHVV